MAAILDLISVDYLILKYNLVSVDYLGCLVRFLWLIGGEWRKVPFDDQRRRSFKMAAILDLVSDLKIS
jgi:hypothetical protein